jgi:anti-sigma B factor antagonist
MSDRQRCVEILSVDNVTILDLEGEIDIYTATEFKEALLQSIDSGAHRILVDLTKVTFMDSAGLSVLVSGERRLRPLGSCLAVACDERIRRVLTITGLDDALALYATRDEALRAAFTGRDSSRAAPAPGSP